MSVPVFSSDIKRAVNSSVSQLKELIHIDPAVPVISQKEAEPDANFKPKTDKAYVPKRKPCKAKVRTVRDIREQFENDIFMQLPDEIDRIEKYFLNKISCSLSRHELTKRTAKKVFRSPEPISRKTWQMITTLNPYEKRHPLQYALCEGNCVRINGSRGGSKKFITNRDLHEKNINKFDKSSTIKQGKKTMLQKSLLVKFQPGPLNKKKDLDLSYQKFNVGSSKVIKLPQIGLEVQPTYGAPIEPTISKVLYSLRENDGKLTEKWAQFAVSTLGRVTKSEVSQLESVCTTFDLSYKNDQSQVLMRSNMMALSRKEEEIFTENESNITGCISTIVNRLLDAVEVNIMQDKEICYDNDDRSTFEGDVLMEPYNVSKDKIKKKYTELEKLDVTVIRLPAMDTESKDINCNLPYCSMGCICSSLQFRRQLKEHCGRVECMFKCDCDLSNARKQKSIDELLYPGLVNLENELNSKLTKEEQKFHQTLFLTEDKSILLKLRKRNSKAPNRYSEYFENVNQTRGQRSILTLNISKLSGNNIEPWCMVHSLYRCFCNGKFTSFDLHRKEVDGIAQLKLPNQVNIQPSIQRKQLDDTGHNEQPDLEYNMKNHNNPDFESETCARLKSYSGRRFSNSHYRKTHERISKMEQNDSNLQEKLEKLKQLCIETSCVEDEETSTQQLSCLENESRPDDSLDAVYDQIPNDNNAESEKLNNEDSTDSVQSNFNSVTTNFTRNIPNMSKLIKWLEKYYKYYKPRIDMGQTQFPLEAPKLGKISLYPWEVILERYNSKKNYFLVTNSEPYRIFLAINVNDPFFQNCIKIENVNFEHISRYPITVRNLLENANDMKNSFYILCGLTNCWELIGHVTKLGRGDDNSDSASSSEASVSLSQTLAVIKSQIMPIDVKCNIEQNKWFIMLVGNDFREIQFQKKGFFIMHNNIMRAIEVALVSKKIVRLSSQKAAGFGIHAVPVEYNCVFIGPYKTDEPLGFETVETNIGPSSVKSKGMWAHTDIKNNINVMDDPVSFIQETCSRLGGDLFDLVLEIDTIKEQERKDTPSRLKRSLPFTSADIEPMTKTRKSLKSINVDEEVSPDYVSSDSDASQTANKVINPIVIKKTSGYYQVAPFQTNKSSIIKVRKIPASPHILESGHENQPETLPVIQNTFSLFDHLNTKKKSKSYCKPIAEIAPQIKQNILPTKAVSGPSLPESNVKKGMFILNPEQINRRIETQCKLQCVSAVKNVSDEALAGEDVENFLSTHSECLPALEADNGSASEDDDVEKIFDVSIECTQFDIGWIPGKVNKEYQLSFALPGFKFSQLYPPEEAFAKINQVLSRKLYIPKDLKLKWQIVHRKSLPDARTKLNYNIDLKKLQVCKPSTSTGTDQETSNVNAVTPTGNVEDAIASLTMKSLCANKNETISLEKVSSDVPGDIFDY